MTLPQSRGTLEFVAATYASAFERRPVRRGEITADSPFYRRMQGGGPPWPAAPTAALPQETTL